MKINKLLISLLMMISFSLIGCSQSQLEYSGEAFVGTWKATSSILNEDQDLLKDNLLIIKANGEVLNEINGETKTGKIEDLNVLGEIKIKYDNSNSIYTFSYDELSETLNQYLENGNTIIYEES